MSTIAPIPTSEEALKGITAGNGISTTLDEVTVGAGHQQVKLELNRYDGRDEDGNPETPEFGIAFEQADGQLDWAEIPPEAIDEAISALARLKRAWNPEASRVQALPPFDVTANGGSYMADAPMIPLEEHEYDAEGLHVQAYRCGDSTGIDRLVGIAATARHSILDWPFYFTPEAALQLADDIRDTALALIADAEVAA
ncbi:hypothetical protein RQN9TF_17965 [Rhodococcus qingshengii]|uniref:hypothetical protein n=1 Tax=Rhodococcus TaxID=1827 RepID=UPI000F6267CC|nr:MULTISPECIES: hypothetical protein [Rhodococcus]AZI62763.1 hypothetical protein EHW12_17520 [Rhodococcus sp. NJ-530]BDQ21103.1 hypothetical protein RQN9TF_17965 [Rhodococcus qingshengii]